jgi:hypothetical protein
MMLAEIDRGRAKASLLFHKPQRSCCRTPQQHSHSANITALDCISHFMQVMQFHDSMRGSNFTYCHWMRAFDPDCRAAMPMHADAVVFLERWEDREQATPGAANMLWHAEWQAAGGATAPPGPPKAILTPQPEVEVANAAALVEAAAAFADWPVLFLGAVPKLGSGDGLQAPSEEDRKCYLFTDEPPHFEPLGSTEEQRQKWLNGTLRRLL